MMNKREVLQFFSFWSLEKIARKVLFLFFFFNEVVYSDIIFIKMSENIRIAFRQLFPYISVGYERFDGLCFFIIYDFFYYVSDFL